jgi:hypothetical protein
LPTATTIARRPSCVTTSAPRASAGFARTGLAETEYRQGAVRRAASRRHRASASSIRRRWREKLIPFPPTCRRTKRRPRPPNCSRVTRWR